ncbi:CHAT domain-containing protein [Rubripirellula reticaptiva]|nr:CHAT domain-containing protein [Rubripirellula reticaptiva]
MNHLRLSLLRPIVFVLSIALAALPICMAQNGQQQTAQQQYVVVTAPIGYLTTDQGDIIGRLPTWTHLLVVRSTKTDFVVITPTGQRGSIRRELVQHNPLTNATLAELTAAESAVVMLTQAHEQIVKQDYAAALNLNRQAGRTVEEAMGRSNPLWPWIMSSVAHLQLANEETIGAKLTMDAAEASLQGLKEKGPAEADLLNVRAMLLEQTGDQTGAISTFRNAVEAAIRHGGEAHSDVRVVMSNLAHTLGEAQEYKEAARFQKTVYNIGKDILPDSTTEQADAAFALGVYLSMDGQEAQAIPYFREALAVYERTKANDDPDLVATREMLAEVSKVAAPITPSVVVKRQPYQTSQGRLRVISKHAYIRDNAGRILKTLFRHSSVKFLREVDDKYEVEYRKTQGWVHAGQLVPDPTYAVDDLEREVRDQVNEARLLHEEALVYLERDQDLVRALKHLERAHKIVSQFDDQATTSSVLKEIAYLHAIQGDASLANQELSRARQLLSVSKLAQNPILIAELENARGHSAFNGSDFDTALTSYTRALEALRSNFGDMNAGTAALYGNVCKATSYKGDLVNAKPIAEKFISTMRAVFGDDTNELSYAYATYSEVLSGLGDHTQAQNYSARALAIRTNLLGPDDIQTGNAHADYGRILWFSGDIDEAERQLDRALEICKRINSQRAESLEVSTRMSLVEMFNEANMPLDALTHTGSLLELMRASDGDYKDQIAKYTALVENLKVIANRPQAAAQQMLIVLRDGRIQDQTRVVTTVPPGTRLWSLKEQDGWHSVIVNADGDKQIAGWIKGQTVTSVEAELFQQTQSSDLLQKQQVAARIAGVMQANQDLFSNTNPTREDLVRAVGLVDDVARDVESVGNNFMLASIRQMLAGIYDQFAEYGKARKHLESALETHIEHLGRNHPVTAQDRLGLAQVLVNIGDTVGAERQFREAVRVISSTTGQTSEMASDANARLALHLINNGAITEGEALLRFVQKTEAAAGRDDRPTMITVLITLSSLAIKANKPQDAIALLQQAQKIRESQAATADIVTDIMLQTQLGLAQLRTTEQEEALRNLTSAHEQAVRDLGPAHSITSSCQSIFGYAMSLNGDSDQALQLTQSALENVIKATGPEHIQTVDALVSVSAVQYQAGNLRETLDLLGRARAVTNKYVRETLVEMPAQAQVQFLENNDRRKRDAALSLVLKHSDDQNVVDQTAIWILNTKGLAVETAVARGSLENFLKTEFSRKQFESWQELRRRISTFPLEGANESVRETRRVELQQLKEEEQAFRSNIAPGFAEQVARQQSGLVDLKSVRNEIADDSILIELFRLRPVDLPRIISPDEPQPARYIAWIIPPADDGPVQFVDLGLAEPIDTLVATTQEQINASGALINGLGSIESTERLYEAMRPLTTAVWEPIRKTIGNSKKLIISPDANLWLIPWAAIPVGDKRYLVEDFEVQLLNTGRDLVRPINPADELNGPVIIADPAFDSDAREIEDTVRAMELDTLRTRSAVPFNRNFAEKRLPGTRSEAMIIQPSLQISDGEAPETYMGEQAAEAVFKSLQRPRALLVGTHGFVFQAEQSDASNPLARCGLLLAGCNNSAENLRTTGEDGVLTGSEIVGTDLRGTQLVVLSACQTGLGTVQDGEGVAGLRQAFQLAGAESVVATLWSIPDQATTALIVSLFDNLALKMTKPAAIRAAQIESIHRLREREGAAHPFFWAAFTLTGQQ